MQRFFEVLVDFLGGQGAVKQLEIAHIAIVIWISGAFPVRKPGRAAYGVLTKVSLQQRAPVATLFNQSAIEVQARVASAGYRHGDVAPCTGEIGLRKATFHRRAGLGNLAVTHEMQADRCCVCPVQRLGRRVLQQEQHPMFVL